MDKKRLFRGKLWLLTSPLSSELCLEDDLMTERQLLPGKLDALSSLWSGVLYSKQWCSIRQTSQNSYDWVQTVEQQAVCVKKHRWKIPRAGRLMGTLSHLSSKERAIYRLPLSSEEEDTYLIGPDGCSLPFTEVISGLLRRCIRSQSINHDLKSNPLSTRQQL